MNKILFLFLGLIFLITHNLFAGEKPTTVILLKLINNRGVEIGSEVVIIKNSKVIVNKEQLSPEEIITQSQSLKKINQFLPNDPLTQCETGTFRHIYNKGKVQKIEYGCLNSDRFKVLLKHFKALKKDHITL